MVHKKTHLLSVPNILLFVSFALLAGALCYLYVPTPETTNKYEQTTKNILQQSKTTPLPLNNGKHKQTPSGSGSKNGYKPTTTSTDSSKATSSQISKGSDNFVIGGNPDGSGDDGDDQDDENPNKKENPIFGGG